MSILPNFVLLNRLRAYLASSDERVGYANTIAFVIAGNQPFYPLYVYAIVGSSAWITLWSWVTTPFFVLVPLLARRRPLAGRLLLVAAGVANTALCEKLLGRASGVDLFFTPCVLLAPLLFRSREWPAAPAVTIVVMAVAVAAVFGNWVPVHAFNADENRSLMRLHGFSVLSLVLFMLFLVVRDWWTRRAARKTGM